MGATPWTNQNAALPSQFQTYAESERRKKTYFSRFCLTFLSCSTNYSFLVPYLLITEFKQINQTVLLLPKTNLTSLQQDAALLQLISFNLFAFILQSSNCLECSRTSF